MRKNIQFKTINNLCCVMHILYSTPYMQGEACVISFVPQQNIQLL